MIERKSLNRFEKIIFDTIVCWQENWQFEWEQETNETFDLDELLEVISQYGPWNCPERELPISATTQVLGWFEREGIVRKIGTESWEILLIVKEKPKND